MLGKRKRVVAFTIALLLLGFLNVANNVAAAPFTAPAKVIGIVEPRSGVYAEIGEYGIKGVQLAVDKYNAAGGILGSELKVVAEDTQSVANVGVQKARKLITEKDAIMLVGEVSSSVAAAMGAVAQELKVIYMASGPNSNNITNQDAKRVMFRIDLSNWQSNNAMANYLLKTEGKRWYFLTSDYTWGWTAYNVASKILKEAGGKELANDLAPFGTSDFSSYLLKIKQANPDVVYLSIGGTDLINFFKQFNSFGLKGKMQVSGAIINDSDAWTLGPGVMTGVWPKVWSYNVNTPGSKEFTEKFIAKYGLYPENESWQDYIATVAYLEAVKRAGTWDYEQVIKQLEGNKFDGLKASDVYFRTRDHQLIQPVYIVKARDGAWPNKQDWNTIVAEYPLAGVSLESLESDMTENPMILQDKYPLSFEKK
jgi:branched-chain amino acid transport system substrate-binding protein